jgi:hypothetical protein
MLLLQGEVTIERKEGGGRERGEREREREKVARGEGGREGERG